MCNWRSQFDVTHALTTHFSHGHFNATLLTDNTAVFHALVFTTQALVVLHRAEDFGTEEAITLRLKGTVVDSFRLLNLTE